MWIEDSPHYAEMPGSTCLGKYGPFTDICSAESEPLPIFEITLNVSVNFYCVLMRKVLTAELQMQGLQITSPRAMSTTKYTS